MTAAVKETPEVDLGALEADAREQIEKLTPVRQRLALDALTSEEAREELANIESELTSAQVQLERAGLARSDRGRREQDARERAEAQRRAEALDNARKLQVQREAACRRVDKAAKLLAEALRELDRIAGDQEAELSAATQLVADVQVRPSPWMIEAALGFAFAQAGTPPGMFELPAMAAVRAALLAESDFRPCEPAEAKR